MRAKRALALLAAIALNAASLSQDAWQAAKEGYRFSFPRDHFEHRQFQTEWWYYTGNLRSSDGHRFGFELTFFRQANQFDNSGQVSTTWRPDQVYLAHLALSDIDGKEFFHTNRLNRAGPGLAGGSFHESRYWNGNWQVRWLDPNTGHQQLQAVCDGLDLKLALRPVKPAIINGINGISRKGPLPDQASHYVTFTRLQSSGTLSWKGKSYALTGSSWMDHEFFTEPKDSGLLGWDWFAIQLDNNQELMLYQIRRRSEEQSPYSSGTFVDSAGRAKHLAASQFSLRAGAVWQSPLSDERYPVSWHISVPSLNLELDQQTSLRNQELFSKDPVSPTYWEGAVTYKGSLNSRPVSGVGYLEMTGYAAARSLSAR